MQRTKKEYVPHRNSAELCLTYFAFLLRCPLFILLEGFFNISWFDSNINLIFCSMPFGLKTEEDIFMEQSL